MNRNVILVLLAATFLGGCGQKDKESDRAAGGDKAVVTNVPIAVAHDFVVVRIDGKDITRSDIVRNGRVVLQLNMNKARKTKIKQREVKAVERYCRAAVNRELSKAAVAKYLDERKVAIPTNVLKRATRKFERQYGAFSKKLRRPHTLSDLKYMLGKNASRADEMIAEMARFEAMTNDLISSTNIIITDEMVNQRIDQIQSANLRAAATNALVFATATNVWRKITSGELTFEAAATKYSQDEYIAEGCEWGTFTREQLEEDTAVLALLPTLKTGDITPPVESDGGLAILRKDEDDNDKTFSFSRVFFKLPYFFDVETTAEMRKALQAEKTSQLVQDTIKSYIGKLKVEYPSGTNLVWKLTAQDFK